MFMEICKKHILVLALVPVAFLLVLLGVIKCCFVRPMNLVYGYPLESLYTNKVVHLAVDDAHPFMVVLGHNREVHLYPKSHEDYKYIPGDFVNAADYDLLLKIEASEIFDVDEKIIVPYRQWEHFSIGIKAKLVEDKNVLSNSCIKVFNQHNEALCEIYVEPLSLHMLRELR